MKKAVIGSGLMISGMIGASSQRIIDTILVANHWQIKESGPDLLLTLSAAAVIGGILLCLFALRER